jgi:hypothetical protein
MAVTFRGTANTYITLGNDATTQNLFVIENGYQSRVNVNIRELHFLNDAIVVLTAVSPLIKVSRGSAISGGQILEKSTYDTTQTSDANVVIRTPLLNGARITATPGNIIWEQFCTRQHTAVGQNYMIDYDLLPMKIIKETGKEFKLRPGEALLVALVAADASSNLVTINNYAFTCTWEEDAIATFAISGTVTLSAVPVEGARVVVVEMDDVLGTNAHLREVILTPAGGTWASTIRTGKVGAAFVQYKNGAIYYTAPGSPYLSA